MLDALSRTPFVDSTELACILGEPHATVHRILVDLLAEDIVGRANHGTAHLTSSQRYHLTAKGIGEAAWVLGFETPSDFVRAYPVSREWLTLLIRRMDAVAAVYRLAASLSPGTGGLRSHVEFHRRGRFDAAITLHDGRSFGVVRQGLALRRRSLYDRLRAIAQYSHGRRPGTVLILVPSAWELRRTARFCINNDLRDCYVAVESRDALERRDLRLWCEPTGLFGLTYYTLSAEGIRYVTHRDRAQLPTTQGIWSTALTTDNQGRRRHVGHRIETWARQTKHADGITWFLSQLQAEARADPDSELAWSVPTARSDRAYNWGDSAIAPDAVGEMTAQGLRIPFYFEHELRARHPRGVLARLRPYTRYYHSNEPGDDQPPYPVTLFVVDTEEVEDTYVRTAAHLSRMSLPIFVSCIPALSTAGILGPSWRPLWEPESPRLPLSELEAYQWDSLYHRMRQSPVGGGGIDRDVSSLSILNAGWGVQNGTTGPMSGVHRPPIHPCFSY